MKKTNHTSQTGFTIIELLVASLLAMILLGSTTVMFVTNKDNAKLQDELGRLQENARFAMDLITKDVRMTDYIGCHENPANVNNQIDISGSTILDFSNTLDGAESSATTVEWEASGGNEIIASMSANTDALTVRYLQPVGRQITSDIGANGDPSIDTGADLPQGELMAISDCSSTDLFQNTSADTATSGDIEHGTTGATPGNSSSNFSKDYDEGAEISRLIARRYYIAASGSGTGSSLWWNDINGTQELVEGIQSMQLLYGEDTNADEIIDAFATADNVGTWDNVRAVKIGLLLETINELGTDVDSNTYNVLGTTVAAANDRRKRKVFTSTIAIRNRM